MTLKQKIFSLLQENTSSYLSGEDIAESFGLSRTAIWKAINALKEDGYAIEAIRNKGYRLQNDYDVLLEDAITSELIVPHPFKIECYERVSSTNTLVQKRFDEDEGLVVIANAQDNGISKSNNPFYSPEDTGVYFSILLKPQFEVGQSASITFMATAAVCTALKELLGVDAKIKLPNEVYVDNKKICGILSKGTFNLENKTIDNIILGIGLYIYMPEKDFPFTEKNSLGSLCIEKHGGLRASIIAKILNEFWALYTK